MAQTPYRFKTIKYAGKDSSALYRDLKRIKTLYFSLNHISRFGNSRLLIKAFILLSITATAYYLTLTATSYLVLQFSYFILGAACVVIGMTFGHDAAHHCLTGNKKTDDALFEIIFGLQGINGYMWRVRHNNSHHPFPNVHEYDSDLEISSLLFLDTTRQKKWIHLYQHVYAPFLYMFFSLMWIFYIDFILFRKKQLANMEVIHHRRIELIKLLVFKFLTLAIFLFIPLALSPLPGFLIVLSFVVMHLINSMLLTFTFFISHHVGETTYASPANNSIDTSWLERQIAATMDFHAESKVANLIFGGFNAHLAHHLFPDVCHIHYPVLSSLIKQSLKEHNIKYNSLNFFKAVWSHLTLLKRLPRTMGTLA